MFAASKTGGVVSAGDPYWSSVSLLTNFENNLTFQDGSTNNFAITRTGVVNPSLNTPFSGVGGSDYFNGSGGYLSVADNVALQMGSGAFTIEAFVYRFASGVAHTICAKGGASTGLVFQITSGNLLRFTDTTTNIDSTGTIAANTWTHVAVVRSGTGANQTKLYIGGVNDGTGTSATTFAQTEEFRIGRDRSGAADFNGNISNLRIVKGTAVYTTGFTPPTAPLTAITNTSLLITGTGQGMFNNATFVDQGPNALTMSVGGSAVYSGLSPFGNAYPGSIYCPTLNDFVTGITADNLSASDWTFEAWVNISTFVATGGVGGNVIISKCVTPVVSNFGELTFAATTAGAVIYIRPTTNAIQNPYQATSAITANTWTHVAAVYTNSNTTLKLYKNGTLTDTFTGVTNGGGSTTTRYGIGQYGNGYAPSAFSGYISNARVAKTAVYTANFTPSTTPLTAITNTSLLVRGDTGAFYDLSNNGNPETGVNSPVVTTQIKQFGNESLSISSGKQLTVPYSTAFNFYNTNATIECWIYATSNGGGGVGTIIADWKTGAATGPSSFYIAYGTGAVTVQAVQKANTYFDQGGVSLTGTAALNAWHHIALTYDGTTLRLFIGGTLAQSTTSFTGFNQSHNTVIDIGNLSNFGTTYCFNGYLDDIRITKGVARYTANFTPPTVTFPTGP